jgi:hypothetical protein
MSEGAKVPEANWNQYSSENTANAMSNVDRRSWARKAFDIIRRNPIAAAGATAVVTATLVASGVSGPNPDSTPTLNPDQQRIHQMEKNGMPQSDEAVKLDKQFPADHVQTKDIVISSNAEILTAPNDEANKVNNDDIIINGNKFVNEKQVTLSNGLEINGASGRYVIFMNVMVGGQETILYIKETAVNHPFGDSSVPATHDANGGYQSTDGAITAPDINVLTTPQTSPLDATPQP